MATEIIRLDFPGGKELEAALRQLPEDVGAEVLETALIAGARPIKDDAAARARLRRGPRRRPFAVPLADTIRTEVREREGLTAVVDVITKHPVAHLREFGHQQVVGGPLSGEGRVVGFVPAYPFMRPAADENAEASVRIIGKDLGREIEAAFARRAPHEVA